MFFQIFDKLYSNFNSQYITLLLLYYQVSMKKTYLFVIAFLTFILSGFTFAQNVSTPEPEVSNLWDVKVRFCNDPTDPAGTRTLTLQAKPGEVKTVCVLLQNDGPTPLKIGINFVDGAFTQGVGDSKKACKPENEKDMFGQYVTIPNTDFELQPNQALTTKVQLRFPQGYAGLANGCLTTHILEENAQEGMVQVLSRRANFIDVYVDGKVRINMEYGAFSGGTTYKNISDTNLLTLYKRVNDGKYNVRYMLQNNGNLPVSSTWSVKLKIFWIFEKEWKDIVSKITASGYTYVDIEMPFYLRWIGGPLTFDLNNDYKAAIDAQMPNYATIIAQDYNINLQAHAFLMPWWLLIFLGLIILIILKKKYSKSKSPKNEHQIN